MCLAQGPQLSGAGEARTRFHGLFIYINDVASMNLQVVGKTVLNLISWLLQIEIYTDFNRVIICTSGFILFQNSNFILYNIPGYWEKLKFLSATCIRYCPWTNIKLS